MTTLRRAFTLAAAFVLAVSPMPTAGAVSLYDAVKTRPAPITPVVPAQNLPALPQSLPGLAPALGADIAAPQIPIPPASQSAGAPQAQADLPRPLADLGTTGAQISAPGGDASAALDAQFDAGIAAHVGSAISEYFGTLGRGEQPGVVVSKKRSSSTDGAPTDAEMENNVKASPKTNPEREQIAIRMFQKGGASYDPATADVKVPDFTRDGQVQVQEVAGWGGGVAHNIFVVKKGKPKAGQKERVIVITSHNDKVDVGDGVIDNWTGATMVAHLYQSVKDLETEATYIFAAFAREEEGLVGSKQFLRSMTPDQRLLIEGNINYDTIAIKGGGTNSWDNQSSRVGSDEVMLAAADAAVAQANKTRGPADQLDLKRMALGGGDADSSSFRRQRPPIPAMTIFSGPEDLIFSIIHSANDNIGAFDFALYKNTYLVAMALIHWFERHPLAAAPAVGHA
ncbi:MAG: M28 family peptidase [Elusimicrobia bacterium]|nr:M28 family peptidase [Elusimicrobiota bacterium]